MSLTSDEYSSGPVNAIGAAPYPSTVIKNANEVDQIVAQLKRKPLRTLKKLASEAFERKPLKKRVKPSNSTFLPTTWSGDPTAAFLNKVDFNGGGSPGA